MLVQGELLQKQASAGVNSFKKPKPTFFVGFAELSEQGSER